VRQHFVEALYAGQPFKVVLRDLGLTSTKFGGSPRRMVSGRLRWTALSRTPAETTSGTVRMPHTVRGCVCSECREHQRVGWRGVVPTSPVLRRAATRLVKKDDHLRPVEKAHRGLGD
jgi:hypothetical protein